MREGRIEGALEAFSARLAERVPAPWGLSRLAPLRARLARAILVRRKDEIARARAAFAADGEGGDSPGAREVARVAASMVAELRGALPAEASARGGRLLAAVARADGRLPTEAMEHVDDPSFAEDRRVAAIRSLDRLNRAWGSYVRFLAVVEPLLEDGATVLDIAAGHAGFPLALARLCRARGLRVRIIASDLRPEYVDLGRRRAAALGERGVELRVVDAHRIGEAFRPGEVDVVTCTQTLHHFGPGPGAAVIASAVRSARRGAVFIDVARTVSGLAAVAVAAKVGSRDPAQFHDGTVSVRKAFVPEELLLMASCATGGEAAEAFFLRPAFSALRLCASGTAPSGPFASASGPR